MESQRNQDVAHIHIAIGEDGKCPSCGKFVGAYERCPYCQASMGMRMSLKLVRRISVIGSIVGLIVLYLASRYHEIPLVRIDAIQINNNMALVKLVGTVIEIQEDAFKNNFKVMLDDGTGRLNLSGFGKLDLFKKTMKDEFMREGDRIEVVGNLNISDKWGASMFLSSPRRIKLLERPQVEAVTLNKLDDSYLAKQIWVEGQITDVVKFKSGYTLGFQDQTGQVELTIFNTEIDEINDAKTKDQLLTVGSKFKIRAKLDKYRDALQLRFAAVDPTALVFLGSEELSGASVAEAKITPLGDIPLTKEGHIVTIKGRITSAKVIKNVGQSLIVDDRTGSETLFIYDNMLDQIAGYQRLGGEQNLEIQAKVKITTYRGKRQLVPIKAEDVILGGSQ